MFALILILLFAGTTIVTHIVITAGILLEAKRERRRFAAYSAGGNSRPSVSLIIPAKNEEDNLPRLFRALEALDDRQTQIVFINDRSDDSTPALLADFQARTGNRVTTVTLTEHPAGLKLNPKQYALSKGIEAAEGEVLLFTDADCEPPPGWVGRMTSAFSDPQVGLCIGPIQTEPRKGFLYKFQHFDHIYRYAYTAGSVGFGMPTGGFGNNLAVRKQALENIGGYPSIGYSVTEDAALIVAVREKTEFRIAACISPESLVTACPLDSWKDLAVQERRWSYGAFKSPDFHTVFGYAAVMIFLFAGLAAIPLAFAFIPFAIIIGSTFSAMLMAAITGGIKIGARFSSYWIAVLPSVLFASLFYSLNNLLALFNAPVRWKGKHLDKM